MSFRNLNIPNFSNGFKRFQFSNDFSQKVRVFSQREKPNGKSFKHFSSFLNRKTENENRLINKCHFLKEHKEGQKIAVAISGGVDSTLCAYLLKKHGFNVIGVHMKTWDEKEEKGFCEGDLDQRISEKVCDTLSIPMHVANFTKEYWNEVFSDFLYGYEKGLTPNPDVWCNRFIKFEALLSFVKEHLNIEKVATGHHARIINQNVNEICQKEFPEAEQYGFPMLLNSIDPNKDQSYFLSMVKRTAFNDIVSPIGWFLKSEVREAVKELGFSNYDRQSSAGICFIGRRKFPTFITQYINSKPGPIVDLDQEVHLQHEGLHLYTLGQRLRFGGMRHKKYVVSKDVANNTLIVSSDSMHPKLLCKTFYVENVNWLINTFEMDKYSNKKLKCAEMKHRSFSCRIRSQGDYVPCKIKHKEDPNGNEGVFRVVLSKEIRGVTEGQIAVFYDGQICLGGSVICSVKENN